MYRLEFHPAHLIRIDGAEWIKLPRTQFQLLRLLHCVAESTLSFRRIHRLLWGIPDDPRESFMLRLTRKRLVTRLRDARPGLPWDSIIRLHKGVGYGLYLKGGESRPAFQEQYFPDRITPKEEMRRITAYTGNYSKEDR